MFDLFCLLFEEILVFKINFVFILMVWILLLVVENILIFFVGIVFIDSLYLLMVFFIWLFLVLNNLVWKVVVGVEFKFFNVIEVGIFIFLKLNMSGLFKLLRLIV